VLTRKVNNARKGYYGYPSSSSGHVRGNAKMLKAAHKHIV